MSIYQDHKPGNSDELYLKNCPVCGTEFRTKPYLLKIGKGKYCSKSCSNEATLFKAGEQHRLAGDKHPLWKGDNVSYTGLHIWVRQWLGNPRKCEHCGTTTAKKYEWANISRQYKRKLDDWIRLCVSCHRKYDGHQVKMWETRRLSNV